jgi:hypothetical protein
MSGLGESVARLEAQAERSLTASHRLLAAAERLVAARAATEQARAAHRASEVVRLRSLADSAWLSAARWGRWEAAVPHSGPVAVLAGQSARVAEVVAVARGVRAAKLA